MTDERIERFKSVVAERTRHVTIVLENIYQPQNASAVLRTCECMGVQDIHLIESINPYQVNKDVLRGSNLWLTLHRYRKQSNPVEACVNSLKSSGYRIVVTSPHHEGNTPDDLLLDRKTAIVMGTEGEGISSEMMKHADGFLKIPMYGFTESMNISVSAAIILNRIVGRMKLSDVDWRLTENEKYDLIFEWTKKSIKKSDLLISEFFTKHGE
ncbi:MAG: TrmH family RNA methyltransferase [Flavobacteriales bacterium]